MILRWAVLLAPLSVLVSEAVTDTGVPVWGMVLTWLALQFVALWAFAQDRDAESRPGLANTGDGGEAGAV